MKNAYARLLAIVAIFVVFLSAPLAQADTITITGNLSSGSAAVGVGDPVITNPATIHPNDAFSLVLGYNPASFTLSGNSFVLTAAAATLKFDGYSFAYTSGAGNYIEFSTPGVFGTGTVSFLICSSLANCSTSDFIDLYFKGTVTGPATLATQASGLTGDSSASPSEFEFLRNFAGGSQTDLQGTLNSPSVPVSTVPEPGTFTLLASGLASLAALGRRFRKN